MISEIINIKRQTNGFNLQKDTDGLDRTYNDILNKYKSIQLTQKHRSMSFQYLS